MYNMIINLFSYNTEASTPNNLFSFNQVVAWSMRKAFTKIGIETRFVSDGQFWEEAIPKADHSIVISGFVMRTIKDNPTFHKKVKHATNGKMTLYLDADYANWWKFFDHVFTLAKLHATSSEKYVYAGWGADPEYCYPEQGEKAVFLDSLMYGYYNEKFNKIYDVYKETLSTCNVKIYNPVPKYREGKRIEWPEMQKIIRKCHFYCLTQPGEGGLTRIEAATCGALLVVPEAFSKLRCISSLEHRVWKTREDLVKILNTKTNIKAIRKKALEHSWDKVVKRMLPYLER